MKILILDVYPRRPYRVCKDTNGGFGAANDYGDAVIPRLLAWVVAKSIDFPPLYAAHVMGTLRAGEGGGHEVRYARSDPGGSWDLCLFTSSIVAHETELAAIAAFCGRGGRHIPIGVIGPFAEPMGKAYLQAGADFIIAGEPEMFFHAWTGEIPRGVVRSDVVVPLDDLALPAWDVIFTEKPPKLAFLSGGKRTIPIAASRGCPFSCYVYCTYPVQQGRKLRLRDPEKIVEEMVHWHRTLGVDHFLFRDPVFAINRKHTLALCDAIEATGLPITFAAESHLKNIDDELAHRLHRAGLRLIYFGIESVSTEVLESVDRFTIDQQEQIDRIRFLETSGIQCKPMFIFGFPEDTEETCRATLDFALKLNTLFAQFCVFTPYPGTPIFETWREKITTRRLEDFSQWRLVFDHPRLSAADLRRILDRAFTRYYFRFGWLFRFLKSRFDP